MQLVSVILKRIDLNNWRVAHVEVWVAYFSLFVETSANRGRVTESKIPGCRVPTCPDVINRDVLDREARLYECPLHAKTPGYFFPPSQHTMKFVGDSM
jgi:hypothetical protein